MSCSLRSPAVLSNRACSSFQVMLGRCPKTNGHTDTDTCTPLSINVTTLVCCWIAWIILLFPLIWVAYVSILNIKSFKNDTFIINSPVTHNHTQTCPPPKKEENKERSVCFIVTNNHMNLSFRIIDLYFIAHKTLYKTDHISFTPPPHPTPIINKPLYQK